MVYDTIGRSPFEWAGMTYPELVDAANPAGSVLLVPVGSLEQHGHHLPVSMDTILVDAVARFGAERAGESVPLVLTPPVWTGYSPHHLTFGGTVSLDFRTLLAVLDDVADAALGNGFDSLLLLNGDGGNAALVAGATSTIGVRHPSVDVLGLTYFDLAKPFIDDVRESDPGGMSHGGEFETSLMLHLRPDLVREDWIGGRPRTRRYAHGETDLMDRGSLTHYTDFGDFSDTGAVGEPELATAEKGERIYDSLGDELASLLEEIHVRAAA